MKEKRDDYGLILEQQLFFIENSCRNYDQGYELDAIRIAGHLRTFLYDSKNLDVDENKKDKILNEVDSIALLLEEGEECTIKNFSQIKSKLNYLKTIRTQQILKKSKSKSILTQMGMKNMLFLDTSRPKIDFPLQDIEMSVGSEPITILGPRPHYALLCKESKSLGDERIGKYYPSLEKNLSESNFCSFEDWWINKIIYDDGRGIVFNRKDLVSKISNLDGYAHIDENIDTKYESFKQSDFQANIVSNEKKEIANLPTLASVRQIAFEFLKSVEKYKEDNG